MKDTNLEQTVWLMKDTVEVASRASSPCACIRLPGFTGVRHRVLAIILFVSLTSCPKKG